MAGPYALGQTYAPWRSRGSGSPCGLLHPLRTPPSDALPEGTAVLVFARTAAADLSERFATLPAHVCNAIGRGLQRQIRAQVRASGLPHVFSTEREQRGCTYGERLGNACADALALGYRRLIVVGGDCPGLRARHLRAAAEALETGRSVVGRDLRGGVYLFGFDGARCVPERLVSLPYCSAVLAKALTGVLRDGHDEVAELERLGDVHDVRDLRRDFVRFRAPSLRQALRGVLGAFAKTRRGALCEALRGSGQRSVVELRGPPAGI